MDKYKILIYSTIAFVIAAGFFGLILKHDSVSVKKIDHNDDGVTDEWQYFKFNKIIKKEFDSNNDSQPDSVLYYQNGIVIKHENDRNFDGTYDTTEFRHNDIIFQRETALENDGRVNYWAFYENNEVVREETDINHDGAIDRWVYYESGKPTRQEIDDDFDGISDQVIDLKEKREKEMLDDKMTLILTPTDKNFEEDKNIVIKFSLKNVTESDLILAKPDLKMEYRAIQLFIKKVDDETTYEEYIYGPRRYSVHEGYLLKAGDEIHEEWQFSLKTAGKIYDGYGDYKIYANYMYESESEPSKKYWSGVIRSDEILITINPNRRDLWMDQYREADKILREELEATFADFDAEDNKYIIKNLLNSRDVSIQQFAVFELAYKKSYSIADLLIQYLSSSDDELRLKSVNSLKELSGIDDDFGVDWKRDFPKVREAGIEKWKQWWVENQLTLLSDKDKEYIQIVLNSLKDKEDGIFEDDFLEDDELVIDDLFDHTLDIKSSEVQSKHVEFAPFYIYNTNFIISKISDLTSILKDYKQNL